MCALVTGVQTCALPISLRIGDGGASGTLAGDIANNGALECDRSGTLTIAGEISGAGSVDQLGSVTTILTTNNSYTGGTTIRAGTERKSLVEGNSVSVRVDLGGRRILKKKTIITK